MTESTHLSQFQLMAQYNLRVNCQIYDLVSALSEEERQRDLGTFFTSIHGTLSHILLGDRAWLGRFATGTNYRFSTLANAKLIFKFESLAQILYPDFADLHAERRETDLTIYRWIQELTSEMLSAQVHYTNFTRGIDLSISC